MIECSKGDVNAARPLFDKIPLEDRSVVDVSALIAASFKSGKEDTDTTVELARQMLDMGQPAQPVGTSKGLLVHIRDAIFQGPKGRLTRGFIVFIQ